MRIAGVAAVLAVSRVAALAGHQVIWSWWSPVAYLWQDAFVVLVYIAVEFALRRTPRTAWILYAAFVAYVALDVPVTRVMSTPMTWTMWRAAGGALGDSIWLYVTPANVAWIVSIGLTSIVVPYGVAQTPSTLVLSLSKGELRASFTPAIAGLPPPRGARFGGPGKLCATFVLVALTAVGPSAVTHVDTRGLDRNAWSALVTTALPRITDTTAALKGPLYVRSAGLLGPRDWRLGLSVQPTTTDLARFRGAAADRNVILVSLESTAAQYLSLYGATEDVMPNLSALARSAIVFDNAYAVYPESIKGLFSMLCSLYPAFDRAADSYAGISCRGIASHLSERGYHTALFHSGRFGYLGMDAVVRNRGFEVLADAGDIGGQHESSFGVDDRTTVDRILAWIDGLPRGDRFFLTYLPIAGHHPYESPEAGPFPADDEFGRYRNALHYGDEALADLMKGLAARHLDEHTIWIVLGDHGEAFGQHDGNFGHTFQVYEENVRVPFLIAAPGLFQQPRRTSQIVSLIDTAPAILDLLGLPPDTAYQGTSVLLGDSRMALFFADYSLGLLGLRDGNLKYIYELDSHRSRLFDLDRDPLEAHNIAGHAETIYWYKQRLLSWTSALAIHD